MLDRFLVNLKKQKSCNIQNICISKQMVSKRFKSSNIQNTGISEKKKKISKWLKNLATYNKLAYQNKQFPSDWQGLQFKIRTWTT